MITRAQRIIENFGRRRQASRISDKTIPDIDEKELLNDLTRYSSLTHFSKNPFSLTYKNALNFIDNLVSKYGIDKIQLANFISHHNKTFSNEYHFINFNTQLLVYIFEESKVLHRDLADYSYYFKIFNPVRSTSLVLSKIAETIYSEDNPDRFNFALKSRIFDLNFIKDKFVPGTDPIGHFYQLYLNFDERNRVLIMKLPPPYDTDEANNFKILKGRFLAFFPDGIVL